MRHLARVEAAASFLRGSAPEHTAGPHGGRAEDKQDYVKPMVLYLKTDSKKLSAEWVQARAPQTRDTRGARRRSVSGAI